MTVLNVYQELEAQGIIYSVQKSGYFVAPFYLSSRPNANSEIRLNKQIEINSLVFRYLKSIQAMDIVPLGSAFPSHYILIRPKCYKF